MAAKNTFDKYLKQKAAFVEKGLKKYISQLKNTPKILTDAMDYSLNAGGKRVRPVLLIAAAEAFGKKADDVLAAAGAVEMLHTYSLIHDDLPSMDNDSLRRGKPTNHKVFGEDTSLLAGDAMLTYVFEVFSSINSKNISPADTLTALNMLAKYGGAQGMVGGQTSDVFAEGLITGKLPRITKIKKDSKVMKSKKLEYFLLPPAAKEVSAAEVLKYIHTNKTGALIKASVLCGAVLGGAKGEDLKQMGIYADNIGLVFQVVDDILDVTVSEKKLGKSGSDAQRGKLTYVTLYGVDYSRDYAHKLVTKAKEALSKIKGMKQDKKDALADMADFFISRTL
ncbi:geranylgeranyl diphosphate synthase [Parelusimicrobium proximum]